MRYNVLLWDRHSIPVRSVAILLRPEADGREMTGRMEERLPWQQVNLKFEYEVIRLWELSPEVILAGGLGTLPLLPLTNVKRSELPGLIREMEGRIQREASPSDAERLWTATYVLLGLEYDRAYASALLQGVCSMRESVTYQAILEEGREEGLEKGRAVGREEGRQEGHKEGRAAEARRIVLTLGTKRFGRPSVKVRKMIENIDDPDVVERLAARLLDVESWADLLDIL
ncbi:MAG: hypothetical protein ACKV0T_03450 [Planctomycetales bacterium]